MINSNEISHNDLLFKEKCVNKQKQNSIKIKDAVLDGCNYCDNLISLEYNIGCLQKSIKYWSYRLSKESDTCNKDMYDSSFELLLWRTKQLIYLKDELTKLNGIYN